MGKKILLHWTRLLVLVMTIGLSGMISQESWGQVVQPTVTTDKLDYAPGEVAIFSGSGWIGDSKIDIHMDEDPPLHADHQHDFTDVPVNADGTWSVQFPIEEYHLGVTFYVTVTGQETGRTAEWVFTDGSWTISQDHTICAGVTNTLNFTVTTTGGTPNGGFRINFPTSFTLSSPTISGVTNWSISISGNSVCLFNNGNNGNRLSNGNSLSFSVAVNASTAGTYQLSGIGVESNGSCPTSGISLEPNPRSTIVVVSSPTLTGAAQEAPVCAGSGAVINLTGLLSNSTSTIGYSIDGVAQSPVTGVVANGSGAASFTTSSLSAANNGQTLQITSVTTTSATPSCTKTFTQNFTLAVNEAPTVTTDPSNQSIVYGNNASFSVSATGSNPISYQWQVDRACC